ncbi:hypothetical protein K439DRAFT_1612006 [Ramaria rubella]|nr:hypothetical protein K439DRAFT_1612006 [Ramaria rubella]
MSPSLSSIPQNDQSSGERSPSRHRRTVSPLSQTSLLLVTSTPGPSCTTTPAPPNSSAANLLRQMPIDISTPKWTKSTVQCLWDIRAGVLKVSRPSVSSSHAYSQGVETSTCNADNVDNSGPPPQSPTLSIPHPDDPESAEFWGREVPPSPPKQTYVDLDHDDMPAWLHKVEAKCEGWGNGVVTHMVIKNWAIRNFSCKDHYCIMTPNGEYIPEQPVLTGIPEILDNGLLGLYEWMIHPQNFLPHRPHEAFITVPNVHDLTSSILSRPLHHSDMIFQPNNPIGRLHNGTHGDVHRIFKSVGDQLMTPWQMAYKGSLLPQDTRRYTAVTYHTLTNQAMLWLYAIMVWWQFQRSCVDLITFCNYHNASKGIRTSLQPAQTVCTKFRGAFSPNPNVIKLLACLGVPAFHMQILDEPPPVESKILLRSWTTFEGFRMTVVQGADWHMPELFVDMFESTARIQAPLMLIPDVDGFASFLDDVQDNFSFHSYEQNFTQPRNVDSNLMDVDSLLRLPPYDLSAVGSNGINF